MSTGRSKYCSAADGEAAEYVWTARKQVTAASLFVLSSIRDSVVFGQVEKSIAQEL
jgi:preprotein translocase subunit SecE